MLVAFIGGVIVGAVITFAFITWKCFAVMSKEER
jgi:hypothetical protein